MDGHGHPGAGTRRDPRARGDKPHITGLQSILVLTGITTREEAQRFPFLPTRIVDSVADLVDDIDDEPRPAGWPPARGRLDRQAAADRVGASAPNGQPPVRAANAS